MARPFCALCTREGSQFVLRPLGKDDAMVRVCPACDEEAPRAVAPRDREYTPETGGLSSTQITEGMRRLMGDAAYEAESKRNSKLGVVPMPAEDRTDIDFEEYLDESFRRHRSGAWKSTATRRT